MPISYVEALLKDFKRSSMRWIGLEVERFGVNARGELLTYESDIRPLLEALVSQKGWAVDYRVEGKILGVSRNLNAISVEPGSQFEVGLQPRKTIFEIQKLQMEIDSEIKCLREGQGWQFLGLGLNPIQEFTERSLLPSPRYRLMDQLFQNLKGRGQEMMRLSCGLQVNIDFENEKEGIEMLRVGFALAPYLSAVFSNSPFYKGRRSEALSERHLIWTKTDPARSGFIDEVFDPSFSLERYAEHIRKVPLMYAYDEEGNVFDPQGKSLNDLPESLRKSNALAAMRQIFTELRLKPCCVEVRFFDEVPEDYRYAAVALTVGLLYDNKNREILLDRYKNVRSSELEKLMHEGAMRGLRSESIHSELCKLVDWAHQGLERRGFKEENLLVPARKLLESKTTPADLLVERISNPSDLKEFLQVPR